jgi:hypothetical protein
MVTNEAFKKQVKRARTKRELISIIDNILLEINPGYYYQIDGLKLLNAGIKSDITWATREIPLRVAKARIVANLY